MEAISSLHVTILDQDPTQTGNHTFTPTAQRNILPQL